MVDYCRFTNARGCNDRIVNACFTDDGEDACAQRSVWFTRTDDYMSHADPKRVIYPGRTFKEYIDNYPPTSEAIRISDRAWEQFREIYPNIGICRYTEGSGADGFITDEFGPMEAARFDEMIQTRSFKNLIKRYTGRATETKVQYAERSLIGVSLMGGKMTGFSSINTNSMSNGFCLGRYNDDSDIHTRRPSICNFCYGMISMIGRPSMMEQYERNSFILSNYLLTPSDIPTVTTIGIRFNAFGELINTTHFVNICRICTINATSVCTLFTKRLDVICDCLEEYELSVSDLPENLLIVYSNPCMNDPDPRSTLDVAIVELAKKFGVDVEVTSELVDKIFSVHDVKGKVKAYLKKLKDIDEVGGVLDTVGEVPANVEEVDGELEEIEGTLPTEAEYQQMRRKNIDLNCQQKCIRCFRCYNKCDRETYINEMLKDRLERLDYVNEFAVHMDMRILKSLGKQWVLTQILLGAITEKTFAEKYASIFTKSERKKVAGWIANGSAASMESAIDAYYDEALLLRFKKWALRY